MPNLDCEGCASKLKKALFKLKGIVCISNFICFVFLSIYNKKLLVVLKEHFFGEDMSMLVVL